MIVCFIYSAPRHLCLSMHGFTLVWIYIYEGWTKTWSNCLGRKLHTYAIPFYCKTSSSRFFFLMSVRPTYLRFACSVSARFACQYGRHQWLKTSYFYWLMRSFSAGQAVLYIASSLSGREPPCLSTVSAGGFLQFCSLSVGLGKGRSICNLIRSSYFPIRSFYILYPLYYSLHFPTLSHIRLP